MPIGFEGLLGAKKMRNQDWENVVFTDESTFQLFANPTKRWVHKNLGIQFRKVKHPTKVHVYGCFSNSGFGKLICFTKNLNAPRLIMLYEKGLLPSTTTLFGPDKTDWILQEDNYPKHQSKLAKKWRHDNGIDRMDWPAASPDLNPIENVWAILKLNVRKPRPSSPKQLIRYIREEWKGLTPEYAQVLVSSMPRRIKAVIPAKGDYIMY